MKTEKFYIPVCTRINPKPSFTLLLVDNFPIVKALLLPDKDIQAHVRDQFLKMKHDKISFNPIQIKVDGNIFTEIVSDIYKKVRVKEKYIKNSIDIIMDSNTLPVIQIVEGINLQK